MIGTFFIEGENIMHKMTSNEIRNVWLNFFKSKGHHIEQGASLVPHNDKTLLWINSGVAALKKYFDGSEMPKNKRLTNVQKSIRTNDIENVGKTSRHHTFFEMLGNFSIGDYFRSEMIPWAFEILTDEKYFGIPKERLYFTYNPSDLDTYNLWLKVGVESSHLIPLEGNYWEIGEGPCGPNTEVFYDRGEKYDENHIGIDLLKNDIDNDRYIEIWGIVFSQFNAVSGVRREDYKELPNKNIDTGAGLERIACIMQDSETNFETDLFLPIIKETEKISNVKYQENKMAFRVIADHIRTCTFAISDGATFSNEGRGYVLRRVLRRAMRYGRKLGINKPFLYTLVDTVCDIMKDFYPYLLEKSSYVSKTIEMEEEKFLLTLNSGETILRKMLENEKVLSKENAFKLYDTYGFPIELTKEICDEYGVQVDEEGFLQEMEKQKERARAARGELQSMHSQSKDMLDFTVESSFTYDEYEVESEVIGLFKDGKMVDEIKDEGDIVFKNTCFYAESGGQVSDTGEISNSLTDLLVTNVFKGPNKQHFHHCIVSNDGVVRLGDKFTLKIDDKRRELIMRNHSATHLLQSALKKVLGEHVHQEGSFVSDEYLRFDFSHHKKISYDELEQIEALVNQYIDDAIKSKTLVLPIEEAKKLNATALFDEKYGDMVRVVTFGDISKEFCGGTHALNTNQLGCFVIEYEESIASGVRRIQARTFEGGYRLLKEREKVLYQIKENLKSQSYYEVVERLNTLIKEKDALRIENRELLDKESHLTAQNLKNEFSIYNGVHLLVKHLKGTSRNSLLKIIDDLKVIYDESLIVLVGEENGRYPIVVYVSNMIQKNGVKAKDVIRSITSIVGGSGGGKDDLASGSIPSNEKFDLLMQSAKKTLD